MGRSRNVQDTFFLTKAQFGIAYLHYQYEGMIQINILYQQVLTHYNKTILIKLPFVSLLLQN